MQTELLAYEATRRTVSAETVSQGDGQASCQNPLAPNYAGFDKSVDIEVEMVSMTAADATAPQVGQ